MPIQIIINLVVQNFNMMQKGLINNVKTQPVSNKFSKISFPLLLKFFITESVLSDISYSRVEDSLDSEKNFEDALDRWDPEIVGTVKRKRISGLLNSNGIRKEIEVIYTLHNL